jgi:hypothetical protein
VSIFHLSFDVCYLSPQEGAKSTNDFAFDQYHFGLDFKVPRVCRDVALETMTNETCQMTNGK